ncbi:MAG: ATP-binding protein [Oscillospiraceae bacterium]|jgi:predicted AAA+ superfamily ATPase|nr:ATP-binding protein [Oscillospiraceae bacterium]
MDRLKELSRRLGALVLFRGLLRDGALRGLAVLLSQAHKRPAEKMADYAAFAAELFCEGGNLTEFIWNRVAADTNPYLLKSARGETPGPALERCLVSELRLLEEVSQLSARAVRRAAGRARFLPDWENSPADFLGAYRRLLADIPTAGYGVFAKHQVFSLSGKALVPVGFPDRIRLSGLKGYERQRQAVVENTLALLEGKPAANVLLYGDAGTGKSATVKAVVNEFAHRGLRLIEIRKAQMLEIPALIEGLFLNPLRFILFIDDLSYTGYSGEVDVLKAILEGTVSAKAPNVVIYATSNRRHLINERFSDRDGDDIHRNETIQEQTALSERFGLSVNFSKPDRAQYLEIVHALALQYGLRDLEDLDMRAERYALERGGRSPRVARQFAEYSKSAEDR